jgi:hypothetical protein
MKNVTFLLAKGEPPPVAKIRYQNVIDCTVSSVAVSCIFHVTFFGESQPNTIAKISAE